MELVALHKRNFMLKCGKSQQIFLQILSQKLSLKGCKGYSYLFSTPEITIKFDTQPLTQANCWMRITNEFSHRKRFLEKKCLKIIEKLEIMFGCFHMFQWLGMQLDDGEGSLVQELTWSGTDLKCKKRLRFLNFSEPTQMTIQRLIIGMTDRYTFVASQIGWKIRSSLQFELWQPK